MSSKGGTDPRVVLYVRAGCHLCEMARDVVERVCTDAGAGWTCVDIDSDVQAPSLQDRYGELLPVALVDGVQQGYWRLDAERLRKALADGAS